MESVPAALSKSRPTKVSFAKAYFSSPLLARSLKQKIVRSDANLYFGDRLPNITRRASADIPAYARVLAALQEKDTFKIWISYLQLRDFVSSTLSELGTTTSRHIYADRHIFTTVYQSLNARQLLNINDTSHSKRALIDALERYELGTASSQAIEKKGTLQLSDQELAKVDPDSMSLSALKSVEVLPTEQLESAPQYHVTRNLKTSVKPIAEFWKRMNLVRSDIESIFGPLNRAELIHLLDATRVAGTVDDLNAVWQRIHTGADPESEQVIQVGGVDVEPEVAEKLRSASGAELLKREYVDEDGSMTALEHVAQSRQADVKMWNIYISGISGTRSFSLKQIPQLGRVTGTDLDPMHSDYVHDRSWILGSIDDGLELDEESSRRSIFDSAPADATKEVVEELRRRSVDALRLTELMIGVGTVPDATTYETLLLAFAQSGDIPSINAIIANAWGIIAPEDESQEVKIAEAKLVKPGTFRFPTSFTLRAVHNAYAINDRLDLAESVSRAMLRAYRFAGGTSRFTMSRKMGRKE
ncbi:uncharacterized protein V2V93DRAFT_374258 [Kockiozyma suomiensis]|uniref:uncharacterized protein n=1 Tax=Kockiozyma suomiensis TaxID=1337062 RepID=UPI003343C5DD